MRCVRIDALVAPRMQATGARMRLKQATRTRARTCSCNRASDAPTALGTPACPRGAAALSWYLPALQTIPHSQEFVGLLPEEDQEVGSRKQPLQAPARAHG